VCAQADPPTSRANDTDERRLKGFVHLNRDLHQDADSVWRYLHELKLRPVKIEPVGQRVLVRGRYVTRTTNRPVKEYKVEPERDSPLQATLKGKAIIHSPYGGRAEVSELKLVRELEDGAWKIAPDEVERTCKNRNKPYHFLVLVDGKLVLDRRRAELEREVLLLGERFFQDRPSELARRLKGYWKTWRGQAGPTKASEPVAAPA
jgi:hypothetical protein